MKTESLEKKALYKREDSEKNSLTITQRWMDYIDDISMSNCIDMISFVVVVAVVVICMCFYEILCIVD